MLPEKQHSAVGQHEINIRNSQMGTLYLVVDFTEELEALRIQSVELVSTLFFGVMAVTITTVSHASWRGGPP